MAQSEAARKAKEKYDARTRAGVYLKLNKGTDADILEKLASEPNVQGYIKALIRADMNK